ncbi:MAG: hypothetical protein F4Z15_02400 [Gammaproteobacteria bacterium]|nr:hypothetical protein [Gammaproteobacteria bacterium]MYD75143.1 hypothetical protein [Gammaproteobacteria bacterium]MYJ52682.1 hypothetical protein [Gammaproteobacteria bacterium]
MNQESNNAVGTSGDRRWIGSVQVVLIVLVIAVALYLARAPSRTDRGPVSVSGEAMPIVHVVKPDESEYVERVDLTGTVTLDRKLTVVSEVVGRVVWVSPDFVNGGTIPAGQVFVKVDPAEFELKVEAAEMAVAHAEALLQAAEDGLPETGKRLPVDMARARLGQARVALDLARLNLERTGIRLPYTARVISSELEVGDLVGPPEAVGKLSVLGVVYRPEALQVRVPIKMADLATLEPAIGRTAEVSTQGGVYQAELSRVSSVVAPETRLARVFLKFASRVPRESLPVPGTFVEARIFGSRRDGVYILPETAAREYDSVWTVADGALRSVTPVTVGRTADGWVVEGFDAGEGVVVSTLSGASEGLKVETSPAAPSQ